MNILLDCVKKVRNRIYHQLLSYTYDVRGETIEGKILHDVVYDIVLDDLKDKLTRNIKVDVGDCRIVKDEEPYYWLKVSDSVLEGSEIVSVHGMRREYTQGTGHVDITMDGYNIIKVKAPYVTDMYFDVNVTTDLLTNFPISYRDDLCELILYAVKADIYNKGRLKSGINRKFSGLDIDELKSAIDEYSEAHQDYDDKLKMFRALNIMIDTELYNDIMNVSLGRIT